MGSRQNSHLNFSFNDYSTKDALKHINSATTELVKHHQDGVAIIGRLPGYNQTIDKDGKYRQKILEKMSVIELQPVGYKVSWDAINKGQWDKVLSSGLERAKAQAAFGDVLAANSMIPVTKLMIIASNDSSINESITSNYRSNVAEQITESLGQNTIMKMARKYLTNSQDLNYFSTQEMLDKLGDKSAALDVAAYIAKGFKVAIPRVWSNTNYTSMLSLTINLNSPYGDPESVQKHILAPLMYLISLAAPVTKYGVFYGQPFVFEVKAAGLMHFKIGAIQSLMVTRGGADTVFNKYSQPLSVEVRLNIIPLVNAYAMGYKNTTIYDGEDVLINNPSTTATSLMNNKFKI